MRVHHTFTLLRGRTPNIHTLARVARAHTRWASSSGKDSLLDWALTLREAGLRCIETIHDWQQVTHQGVVLGAGEVAHVLLTSHCTGCARAVTHACVHAMQWQTREHIHVRKWHTVCHAAPRHPRPVQATRVGVRYVECERAVGTDTPCLTSLASHSEMCGRRRGKCQGGRSPQR